MKHFMFKTPLSLCDYKKPHLGTSEPIKYSEFGAIEEIFIHVSAFTLFHVIKVPVNSTYLLENYYL